MVICFDHVLLQTFHLVFMCFSCAFHVLFMCFSCAFHVLFMCFSCAFHVLFMCCDHTLSSVFSGIVFWTCFLPTSLKSYNIEFRAEYGQPRLATMHSKNRSMIFDSIERPLTRSSKRKKLLLSNPSRGTRLAIKRNTSVCVFRTTEG
jgi:hypothetical protein